MTAPDGTRLAHPVRDEGDPPAVLPGGPRACLRCLAMPWVPDPPATPTRPREAFAAPASVTVRSRPGHRP
ncbi:hypothetical protein ACIQFU_27545 [Streptomyces sp. NPDC093065]|uniref:hypothetical protein n=1 Tax=Streptomyces sp. NPDC093065 TaxID=3366021 RepID=UPI00382BE6E4